MEQPSPEILKGAHVHHGAPQPKPYVPSLSFSFLVPIPITDSSTGRIPINAPSTTQRYHTFRPSAYPRRPSLRLHRPARHIHRTFLPNHTHPASTTPTFHRTLHHIPHRHRPPPSTLLPRPQHLPNDVPQSCIQRPPEHNHHRSLRIHAPWPQSMAARIIQHRQPDSLPLDGQTPRTTRRPHLRRRRERQRRRYQHITTRPHHHTARR